LLLVVRMSNEMYLETSTIEEETPDARKPNTEFLVPVLWSDSPQLAVYFMRDCTNHRR
jgi:hypothetical protein